ncbi:hypothetical protein [uncultured Aeromicrobium sp.]|uniref:hypothetical protein n=1 Tax=uncultured Aeromicrobium sp. TaxID=337820 RepID=UPI0025D60B1F|nr:hypothetical protein [uncultured Aeromicrobium sp.]
MIAQKAVGIARKWTRRRGPVSGSDDGEYGLPSERLLLVSRLVVGSCTWQVFSLA